MSNGKPIVVIGAGISGLATAWWLHKAGCNVLVLERDSSVGGVMKTFRDGQWLVERGPNSALETTPLFKRLFNDVQIAGNVVYAAPEASTRYILRNGRLHPLPMTPLSFLASGLWSAGGKLRLLKEPFVGKANREETVAEFVERRLGREFLDYAINPFVAGVYAGNPEELSIRAAFPKLYALEEKYGSIIKGQIFGARDRRKLAGQRKDRARMFSFDNGMQTLARGIGAALGRRVLTDTSVEKIFQHSNGTSGEKPGYDIIALHNGERRTINAHAVVLAVPSFAAARFVDSFDSALANSLKNVRYAAVAEIFLGFRTSDIPRPLDGFGFLVPAKERRNILGTIWSSALFPRRAPAGHAALTTFIGGSRQSEMLRNDDNSLIKSTVDELKSIMHVSGDPVYSSVIRTEHAIPQYTVGYGEIVQQIEEFENRHAGLFLTGNYRGGVSVADCVISSDQIAQRVLGFVNVSRTIPVTA